jgi:DNA-binding NtrC family response regulator
VIFLAVLPTVISSIVIIILMQFGIAINATIVLPSTITVLLVIVVWSDTTTGLFGVLSVIPGTGERQLRKIINDEVMRISAEVLDGDHVSLKERLRKIEHQVVGNVYHLCGEDKALTAEMLRISDSSLRRKLPTELRNTTSSK